MQIRFCLALFMPRIRPNTFDSLECCPNAMAFFYFRIPSNPPNQSQAAACCAYSFLPSPPTSRKRVTFWPQSRPKKLLKREEREEEEEENAKKGARRNQKPMTVAILMPLMMLSFWLIPILILYIRGNRVEGVALSNGFQLRI